MSNHDVQFNLIVLTTRGKPQFILESESASQDLSALQVLPQVQARKQTLPDGESVDEQSFSELVNRQPEHEGGWTIRELTSKE
jgi:hypothetical protein